MFRSALVVAALTAALTTLSGTAAQAAPGAGEPTATTVSTGSDVSYPQCGARLPERREIAVVGVNRGTGTTSNPCLRHQLAWGDDVSPEGRARRADVYVNTANPGHLGDWWPGSDLTRAGRPVPNPQGRCAGAEDAACAYVYGYSIATEDLWERGVSAPADRTWWLDVETMNSWSWNRPANLAVLEGMAAAIRAAGADVGVYSTAQQWALIIGDSTPSISLAGAPSWIAGATSRTGALEHCAAQPFTPGGRVRMVQWVEHGRDHDVACGVGVAGTRPSVDGDARVGEQLVAHPGGWGPDGVTLRYRWTRDGEPIDFATGAAYSPTEADDGAAIAVTVTGSRLGAPALSLTSPAVHVAADPAALTAHRAVRFGF